MPGLLLLAVSVILIVTVLFSWMLYRSRNRMHDNIQKLVHVTESMDMAQEIAHIGNWDWNLQTDALWWSDEIYRILGLAPKEFEATYEGFLAYVHPADKERVKEAVKESLENHSDYRVTHRIVRKDGTLRYLKEEGSIQLDERGMPLRMIGVVHDITEQKQSEIEIEKLSKVVEQIDDSVVITDNKGVITYANGAFYSHTGYRPDEVLGNTPRFLKSGQHTQEFYQELWKTILKGEVFRSTLINKKHNGELFYEKKTITPLKDDLKNIIGYVSSGKDITTEMMLHQEIKHIASTDNLTGVYNRHKFEELFILEHERCKRFEYPLSLILIDIDHFKKVNDTYGHDVGDEVLKSLANIIQGRIRKLDVLARWGGEEFLILAPNTDEKNAYTLAEELRMEVESHDFPSVGRVTISVGISQLYSQEVFKDLFKRADRALYKAKGDGRNRVETDASTLGKSQSL